MHTIFFRILFQLICGSKFQTMYSISIPLTFNGRFFVDLYRAFLSRNIYILALYRAPDAKEKSILPYVCSCPRPDAVLRPGDRAFIYCSPVQLKKALEQGLNLALIPQPDGSIGEELDYIICVYCSPK